MINQLAGVPNLVQVQSLAIGGTNTAMGTALLKYDLSPGGSAPDVLINAYSTNDMHGNTMAQEFVRTATECKDTVLFWLDDYLGNEQLQIVAVQELSQSIHVLANYHGFGSISYADAVRNWVYGDTRENMFSPAGWYKSEDTGMVREIHRGHGMHLQLFECGFEPL